MKNIRSLAAGFALLALVALPGTLQASDSAVVTVLHVNDTHSHLEAEGPRAKDLSGKVGGIARAATLIGRERAADPNALLLHAGDALQGDPSFNAFYGVPELEMIALLGFDSFTVGNHEFDFGSEIYGGMILPQAPGFEGVQLLGANVENLSAVPSLESRIRPWVVRTVNGVMVGIVGVTVPGDLTSSPSPLVIGEDFPSAAGLAVAEARAAGAEVVIVLSHLGILYDHVLVQSVPGIDAVVGGHDHNVYEKPVWETAPDGRKVPILQAGAYWQHVGRLRFTVSNGAFKLVDYRMLDADESVPPEPTIAAAVEELRAGISGRWGDLFATRLGTAVRPLDLAWDAHSARRDTPLGNFVTDAFRELTKTDVALTPIGLLGERIAEGPITGLDVFRAVSYGYDPESGLGFRLSTATITGEALLAALELGVSQAEYTNALFPQTSGLTFAYNVKDPPMARVLARTVFVGGHALRPDKVYTLTVNEGVAFLLGAFGIPIENVTVLPNAFEYTVVRDEVLRRGTVRAFSWGRIVDVSEGFDDVQ